MRKTIIGPDVGSDLDMFDGVEGVDGLPHSEAVSVELPEHRRVFVSGTAALDEDGAVIAPGDPAGQMQAILESIEAVLSEVGGDMRDVVRIDLVSEPLTEAEYLDVCRVRESFLPAGHEPASTMVESGSVGLDGMCIEADADAVVPRDGWEVDRVTR